MRTSAAVALAVALAVVPPAPSADVNPGTVQHTADQAAAEARTSAIIVASVVGVFIVLAVGTLWRVAASRKSEREVETPVAAEEPSASTPAQAVVRAPSARYVRMGDVPFAVLDLETTGLNWANRDRVIEVGIVRLSPTGDTVREFTTLINPERKVAGTRIHGIRTADVQAAPFFRDVLGDIGELLEGAIIVAHNAEFDRAFLVMELARAGYQAQRGMLLPTLDTLFFSRQVFPGLPDYKLPTCATAAGYGWWDPHDGLGDARATAFLFAHILKATGGAFLSDIIRSGLPPPGWTGVPASGRTHFRPPHVHRRKARRFS